MRSILNIFFFALVFVFLFGFNALAQWPSFEVYPQGGKSYPIVTEATIYNSTNFIIITARAADISGVLSVTAKIQDPANPGQYMSVDSKMYDDGTHNDGGAGDDIYGIIIDVSNTSVWDVNATYWVDISTTDNLLNNSMTKSAGADYANAGSFVIGEMPNMNCQDNNGASICIDVSPTTNLDQISSFTVSPSTSAAGTSVTLTANLGASGQTIFFTDQTASVNIGSAATNSSGIATIQYTTTLGTTIGSHTLIARYVGGSVPPSQKMATFNVASAGNCKDNNGAAICINVFTSTIPPPPPQ